MTAALLLAAGDGASLATEDGMRPPSPPTSSETGDRPRGGDAAPRSRSGGAAPPPRSGGAAPERAGRPPASDGDAVGIEGVVPAVPPVPDTSRAAALVADPAPEPAPAPAAAGPVKPAPPATGPGPDGRIAGDAETNGEAGSDADTDGEPGSDADANADADKDKVKDADAAARIEALCEQLTAAADRHEVPHDFFIRLIWKESRFNANAVSPVGAQGIAQFMPATARLRGLDDPFDPDQALTASAHFLRDLKNQLGVWGLAAAGYNAGPNRALAYLAGRSGLPYETLDFVHAITGREAGYWKLRAGRQKAARASPPAAPRPLPLRSERPAAPPSLAPEVAAAKAATPAIAPPVAASAPDQRAVADGATVEGTGVKMVVHRPRATDGPPDDLGPSSVPGIVVHRPTRSGRPDEPEPVTLASTAAAIAVPRLRPEIEVQPVDCTRLIVALGRARTTPRPAFGGGVGGGGWSPWGAQVAGHPQRDIALRQFGRHRARLPGDLHSPSIIVRRFPARGRLPIHAVQFGAGSRSEAQATCARVSKALVPCVVVKNR